jgi:hypothetical protein
MESRRLLGTFTAGALLVLAGGCGGGSSSASAGTAPPTSPLSTAAATAAPSGATNAAAATGQAVDVCTLMSPTDLSGILGTMFTKIEPDSTMGVVFSCNYTGGDNQLGISVTVSGGGIGYQCTLDTLHTVGHDPDTVTGVGDKAFSQKDPNGNAGSLGVSSFASYGALYGDVYIQVDGLDYVTAAQGKQIVEQIHAGM